MQDTPKGLRLHIALAGRRNAGKSTLLNALAGQEVSITSAHAGTTTDPVEKTMEIAGIGPVVLVDTAGSDDLGELGEKRAMRSLGILGRTDIAIIVTDGTVWEEPEQKLAALLAQAGTPFIVARNKIAADILAKPCTDLPPGTVCVDIEAKTGRGLPELIIELKKITEKIGGRDISPVSGLLAPDSLAVLVVPIDSGAPKGRLILPQVQTIRGLLDGLCSALVVTEIKYANVLQKLAMPPDLVVCDSQVVEKVAALTPLSVPFTTFSILMARMKGNLAEFAAGAAMIDALKPGDTVLVQEACSHHPQKDDIGRVKIPALLKRKAGGDLHIVFEQGKELYAYPKNIRLIVHCGACVITSGHMQARQKLAREQGIAMTNYGMAISHARGVLERVLSPFADALSAWRAAAGKNF